MTTQEERNWAMAAHLSALIAVAGLPFGHVIGPLVVYLIKGAESPLVSEHGRASLNYQLTISLAGIVGIVVVAAAFILMVVGLAATSSQSGDELSPVTGIGIFAMWCCILVGVLLFFGISLVFIIQGTIAASDGRPYTYPFAIRFLR